VAKAFLLLFVPLFTHAKLTEFEFNPLWTNEYESMTPIDVDGDGHDEFLNSRHPYDTTWIVEVQNVNGETFWQKWPPLETRGIGFLDFDGDGKSEVLVREKIADTVFLLSYSAIEGTLENRYKIASGKDIDSSGHWDGNWVPKGILDVDGDGSKELLISVEAGLDLYPRELAALDPQTGELLWIFPMGVRAGSVRIVDLNGDGKEEIIFGTSSNANGSAANGTNDSTTYVMVLDCEGEPIWQREIGGYWSNTRIEVVDFDRDGSWEISVVEETHRTPYLGPDRIMILDGLTGKTEKVTKIGHTYLGELLCDLDRDEVPEIITGNTDGVVRAFNGELEEVARYVSPDSKQIRVMCAGDIDGDGHSEVLIMTYDGALVILNDRLQEVGCLEEVGEIRRVGVSLVNAEREKKILTWRESSNGGSTYTLFDVRRRPAVFKGVSLIGLIPFLMLLALVAGLAWLLERRRKSWIRGLLSDHSCGILILARGLRIRAMNRKAKRMLGLDENLRATGKFAGLAATPAASAIKRTVLEFVGDARAKSMVSVVKGPQESRVEVEVEALKSGGWLVRLREVSEREFARRVSTWVSVAQQLAHGIKNPLSHIQMVIQNLAELAGKKGKRYAAIGTEEVRRLLDLTDGFMRFSKLTPPKREPCSVEELANRVVARIKPVLPSKVSLKVQCDPALPEVEADKAQLSTVLDHLLDNALAAVGKQGKITIKAKPVERLDSKGTAVASVEIRISDTGGGIPSKYIHKVFEPYFSLKKKGTGLGLTMVRKIVEDHGGTITIDSKEGLGTTFIIILPVKGDGE